MFEKLRRTIRSEPDLTWLQADRDREVRLSPPEPAPAAGERPAYRRRRLEFNAPLIVGGLVVLGLFLIVLFGPLVAPHNPYLSGQQSTMTVGGELIFPPFPPMAGMPLGSDQWGRDIFSMLLYGTRNTLVACLFIAMARVLLGGALGMLAGWNEGGLLDRAVMSLVETTTALPALLAGMILISALGIQRGITVFIFALCFVGWAEIAQYIRSEFMVVRRRPFIEGARVIGLNGLGIAVRHILPNILPALVIIAVLEMGAVLMILGELGFVGVFIGGGGWVQVGDTAIANIPDVPEWGAMMAGARQFARSQTWMVFYPALAFFLAVLGFNLLGEGLRRIVQERGVSTAFILSKRMLLVVGAVTAATAYIVTHVGPAPSYASLAQAFDSEQAYVHLAALASPELQGRQAGTEGAQQAAAYIAEKFEEYGLETVKSGLDYRLPWTTRVVEPLAPPVLDLLDGSGQVLRSFSYRSDFGVDIRGHGGPGAVSAPVSLLTFSGSRYRPEDLAGLDLRGQIALCLAENVPADLAVEAVLRGALGIVLVDDDIVPRLQLGDPEGEYLRPVTLPIFHLLPEAATALFEGAGLDLAELRGSLSQQDSSAPLWNLRPLNRSLRMQLAFSPVREVSSDNVVGVFRGSDAQLNKQLVVVATHYDGPGRQADGTVLQSANDGPSGVAVMLEIVRLWTRTGFQPRRTVYFVAWSGGDWERSGAHHYLAEQAPYSVLEPVAVVNLDGLGRGNDELLATGDAHLVNLLLRTADSAGLAAREGQPLRHAYQTAFGAPMLTVGWADSGTIPSEDTLESLDQGRLGAAGQAINLALITLAREYEY